MTFVSGLCIGGILQRCQHKYCYRQWATGAPATQVSYHIASAQSPIKCQPLFMNIQTTLDNSKFKKNHFSSSYARFWLRYSLSYGGNSWLNLTYRDNEILRKNKWKFELQTYRQKEFGVIESQLYVFRFSDTQHYSKKLPWEKIKRSSPPCSSPLLHC